MSENARLHEVITQSIHRHENWLAFDLFMAAALYTPELGYYSNSSQQFGALPSSGSDYITAPVLSPYFGQALAAQLQQALQTTHTHTIWEFGAGSGALASHILTALGNTLERYVIVDLSATLREQQRLTIQRHVSEHAHKVHWVDQLPEKFSGVVVGNEVLDAMPVKLIHRLQGQWHERGVSLDATGQQFCWDDRPTSLHPPVTIEGHADYLTELPLQAEGFIRTLADRMECGAAFFIDYGFSEHEFYHPQRNMGTLMCHRLHKADTDPLVDVGLKDITAHVNFTGIALAAQESGMDVLGYTTQAHFLLNCGMLDLLPQDQSHASLAARSAAFKLIGEHAMGEIFKVIALGKNCDLDPLGFANGDRTHTL